MKLFYSYHYQGINHLGQKRKGFIQAQSLALAKTKLQQQGLYIQSLRKNRIPFFNPFNQKITQEELSLFSRQLSTLIESGVPLAQSLEIIAKGQTNYGLKLKLETIKQDLETGLTLTESLAKHPSCFNDLVCHLIHAGEKSGALELLLKKIASYQENMLATKKKIKKALTYPLAILIMTLSVTFSMLMFVVPQFEALFKGFGAELPALTKAIVSASKGLQSNWPFGLCLLTAFFPAYFILNKKQIYKQQSLDKLLLVLPIIGNLLIKAAIARFARTLSITFAAGLPLVDALKTVAGATGNSVFAKASLDIKEELLTGQALNVAMENRDLFPTMVLQMVSLGEESGTLEKMLGKVADFYEEDLENAVDSLSNLLEPIIMCILGVLVGGFIVALYLPLFKLGSVI